MKKRITLVFTTLLICHFSYAQLTLGSQTNQTIKVNLNITFTQPGDTLNLTNCSIETSGTITFTNRVINLNQVSIKSDSTILFTNPSTVARIKNVADISCDIMKFPSTLLSLQGVSEDEPKENDKSPALTIRFTTLTPPRYSITSDESLSYSVIIK